MCSANVKSVGFVNEVNMGGGGCWNGIDEDADCIAEGGNGG